jgi:hypothetical protein
MTLMTAVTAYPVDSVLWCLITITAVNRDERRDFPMHAESKSRTLTTDSSLAMIVVARDLRLPRWSTFTRPIAGHVEIHASLASGKREN